MIIVRIMGGLGNQMFQYAAGKRLAVHHGTELKLDVRYFQEKRHRRYLLDRFFIPEKFANRAEIRMLVYDRKPWWSLLSKKARLEAKDNSRFYIREKHYHLNEEVLYLGPYAYLHGFWQSEVYFKDIESEIREAFTFRNVSGNAARMADLIRSSMSVSLHFRRGDYVEDEGASRLFGTLSMDYYRGAVDYIGNKVGSPHLFIFGDDLDWIQANVSFDCPTTVVDVNASESPLVDLYLMSLCRHNIIANSSFSWWGAWLNGNDSKEVVAPAIWFRSGERDTKDLIPAGWKRI